MSHAGIPWENINVVERAGQAAVAQESIRPLARLFREDATQQLAYRTLVSEVLRGGLAWHVADTDMADDTVPVPGWWGVFVKDAIRSIVLTGCFVYRKIRTQAGVPVCLVADPADTDNIRVLWNTKTLRYEPSVATGGWRFGMIEPPERTRSGPPGERAQTITNNFPCRGVRHTNSACARARLPTVQLRALVANWVDRDRVNSAHTVYTTVSSELRSQNGSDRQWFRNTTSSDVMQTRSSDIDVDFHTLVHRRAETIAALDGETNMRRSKAAGAAAASSVGMLGEPPAPEDAHEEHIISDGREYTEARQLGSQPDSKLMMDELKHAILFAFGVPPQALGRNINSERIASSGRLTECAITTYMSLIKTFRDTIGAAVRAETTTDKGSYIGFAVCLSPYELENVQHLLTDKVCRTMVARTNNIPESFIDMAKLRRAMEAGDGAGPHNDKKIRYWPLKHKPPILTHG